MTNDLVEIQKEVSEQLSDKQVAAMLIATTFKGLSEVSMKEAAMEGRLRGFTFDNFLKKDVYAIPFSNGYSLVTSIDYSRKVGAKSGIVGEEEPVYGQEEGLGLWCSKTVKKQFPSGYVGSFTSKVYFDEYTTGKNLWTSKPRTMIAKVAEMHALRMACPEELSQAYIEEEMQQEVKQAKVVNELDTGLVEEYEVNLKTATTVKELQKTWAALPGEMRNVDALIKVKDEMKAKLTPAKTTNEDPKV